jgi:hypothetical protein
MKLLKYALGFLFCNAFRFLRIIPNCDPIMGCALPFAKQGKWWHGAIFALLAMVFFDFITMKVGVWTIVTALAYAGIAGAAHFAYKRVGKVKLKHYLGSGIAGVLAFDFVTGVLFGPVMFGMSYAQAIIGQIPFTAMHLLSATAFILVLVPLLDRAAVGNPAIGWSAALNRIKVLAGA